MTICGETLSSNVNAETQFYTVLTNLMWKNPTEEQLYNCDKNVWIVKDYN